MGRKKGDGKKENKKGRKYHKTKKKSRRDRQKKRTRKKKEKQSKGGTLTCQKFISFIMSHNLKHSLGIQTVIAGASKNKAKKTKI